MTTASKQSAPGHDGKAGASSRRGNAQATKANIIAAARKRFATLSYDAVSLRAIAGDAGINASLVLRYFRSKDELFAAAIGDLLNPDALISGPRETLGRRLAERTLAGRGMEESFTPILLMLCAARSAEAQAIVQGQTARNFTGPFATWLGGDNAETRAHMIAAMVAGTIVQLSMAPPPIFTDIYADMLADAVQKIVDG